ncbi:HET-domain-containing protein [Nemania abortiva]|nr:HET-domain-containing protein [Nemania abortiva]
MVEANKVCRFANEKTLALKRELVAGDYPFAHSCCHCNVFAVPDRPSSDYEPPPFEISITVDEIHRLASAGCLWFGLFSDKITYNRIGDDRRIVQWHYAKASTRDIEEGSVLISMKYALSWGNSVRIEVALYDKHGGESTNFLALKQPDIGADPGWRAFGSPINTNPGSEESFQLIRSWLESCSVEHGCGIRELPPSLPTFLLAIDQERVCLVDTAGKAKDRYVALSYCWGTEGQKTLLLDENKQQFLSDIAFENLDPTIQDAIYITRKVGFSYLWIDALCIVQDDEEAKFREMARMHEVYRNATFTLIASRAASVRDGVLSKREVAGGSQPQCIFKLRYLDNSSNAASRNLILVPVKNLSRRMNGEEPEPWVLRAWTLQERVASRRCLRFGGEQTTWSCSHGALQYRESDGWVGEVDSSLGKLSDIMKQTRSNSQSSYKDVWPAWCEILAEFSWRRIKYQGDRLPAISSIAREFGQALNDDYICGLWKARFHESLLWHAVNRDPFSVIQSSSTPSWSWASNRGSVTLPWRDVIKDDAFETLGHHIVPQYQGDAYGAIESASLRVRGLISPIPETIVHNKRADLVGLSIGSKYQSYYRRDRAGRFKASERSLLLYESQSKGCQEESRINDLFRTLVLTEMIVDDPEIVPSDEGYREPRGDVTDLGLLIIGHGKQETKLFRGPCGLIISKHENGTYRRIGYFNVQNIWGDEDYNDDEAINSHSLVGEYRSRVLYLWGGKDNIREITLV